MDHVDYAAPTAGSMSWVTWISSMSALKRDLDYCFTGDAGRSVRGVITVSFCGFSAYTAIVSQNSTLSLVCLSLCISLSPSLSLSTCMESHYWILSFAPKLSKQPLLPATSREGDAWPMVK